MRRRSIRANPMSDANPAPPVEPQPPELLATAGAGVTSIVALPRMLEFRGSASVTVCVPAAEKMIENEFCPPGVKVSCAGALAFGSVTETVATPE